MSGLKRVRINDTPDLSVEEKFAALLENLPPILTPKQVLNDISPGTLPALNCMVQIPKVFDHGVLSSDDFDVVSLGPQPKINFMGYRLGEPKCEELLTRLYAKAHTCKSIIKCADGYLGIPNFAIHRAKVYLGTRTVSLKQSNEVDALVKVAMTAVIENSVESKVYNKSEITLLISALSGMYSITDPDVKKLSTAITDLKGVGITDLETVDTSWMKGRSRALYDTILGVKLSTVTIDRLAEILQASNMQSSSKQQLWVMHPDTALPFLKRKADAYNSKGITLQSVKLIDVKDEDQVQCVSAFITQTSIQGLSLNSHVYVNEPVYGCVGKGKGGSLKMSATPATDRQISGKVAKAIAGLNNAETSVPSQKGDIVEADPVLPIL